MDKGDPLSTPLRMMGAMGVSPQADLFLKR